MIMKPNIKQQFCNVGLSPNLQITGVGLSPNLRITFVELSPNRQKKIFAHEYTLSSSHSFLLQNDFGEDFMDSKEAVNLINILLKRNNCPFLTETERLIFCDSWNGISYEETANKLNYTFYYTRNMAGKIWQRLSPLFEHPVSKYGIKFALRYCDRAFYLPSIYKNQDISLPHYYQPYTLEETISQDIIENHFQVIGISGMRGTGKTTLAQAVTLQVTRDFDFIIWHSFETDQIEFSQWIDSIFKKLNVAQEISIATNFNQQISRLINLCKQQRCLFVFDQLEKVFAPIDANNKFNSNQEAYQELIKRMATEIHQSYLIFTAKEYPPLYKKELEKLRLFKSVPMHGISVDQGRKLLTYFAFNPRFNWSDQFLSQFDRNPFALLKACSYIEEFYQGDLAAFMENQKLIFNEIIDEFKEEFMGLSPIEKTIMLSLSEMPKCFPKRELYDLQPEKSKSEIDQGLQLLAARSLLKVNCGFILIPALFQCYLKKITEAKTDKIKTFAYSL